MRKARRRRRAAAERVGQRLGDEPRQRIELEHGDGRAAWNALPDELRRGRPSCATHCTSPTWLTLFTQPCMRLENAASSTGAPVGSTISSPSFQYGTKCVSHATALGRAKEV